MNGGCVEGMDMGEPGVGTSRVKVRVAMVRVRHGDWLFSSVAEDLRDVCSSSAVVTVSAVAAGPHDHSLPQHKSILSGQISINFLCVAAARFYWTSTRSRPNPVTKQRKMS